MLAGASNGAADVTPVLLWQAATARPAAISRDDGENRMASSRGFGSVGAASTRCAAR
jgi:hypothetical protein